MKAASGAPPRDEDHPAAMARRAAATRHAARSSACTAIVAKATRFLPSRLAS